jgi:DNA segregation ATPase FtsK/SpoIIIE, S-DNA-T family
MAMKYKDDRYRNLYGGIVLSLITVLLLLSIVQGENLLSRDHETLQKANLSFFDIILLRYPAVDNIIGPFGAFFGYLFILLAGSFFSYCLLLAFFLIGLIKVIAPDKIELIVKALCIIFAGYFFNIFSLAIESNWIPNNGYLVTAVFEVLMKIFNNTGTAVISAVLTIAFVLVIIETGTINLILSKLSRGFVLFWRMLTPSSKMSNKKQDLKSSSTDTFKKDNKVMKEKGEPKAKLKITDHSENNQNTWEEYKKEELEEGFEDYAPVIPIVPKPKKQIKKLQVAGNSDEYQKPDIELFLQSSSKPVIKDRSEIENFIQTTSKIIIEKLAQLKIEAEVVNVNIGPIITQYEIRPAPNIKVNRFTALPNDLALAIKAKSIRIQAPIPGKGLIGIEVPNKDRDVIYLKDILLSEQMKNNNGKLVFALGKDIVGNPVVTDLAKMPHLLIAGATGSGKSVCVNAIICNLLFRTSPEDVRLVMIDPKRIELSGYEGIPHLIQNVISDQEEALVVLNWAVGEMERRYELLQQYNVRDIDVFNKKMKKLSKEKDRDEETEDPIPYIIIIIDEFADLILKLGRDVEFPITLLAQKARAIGIHLIIATQRPSMKIITGLIKANFPARIAFRVAQKVDSRVILDANGAESLLGYGDMLFIPPTKAIPERIHGAYVSDEEIESLVDYLRTQPKPEKEIEFVSKNEESFEMVEYDDELFIDAAKLVVNADSASVSMLQRHFKIGYARAGRLIDMLERAKIIGKHEGSKSREVIATHEVLNAYNIEE